MKQAQQKPSSRTQESLVPPVLSLFAAAISDPSMAKYALAPAACATRHKEISGAFFVLTKKKRQL